MKARDQYSIDRVKHEARELILQKGARGWTMDLLARRAGMAKDTLYRMYPSKERLIREILIDGIASYQDLVGRIDQANQPYEDALQAVIGHFSVFAGQLALENVQDVFREYPAIEAEIMQAQSAYYAQITTFLDKGRILGHLRPDLDVGLLIKIINAYTVQGLKNGKPEALGAEIEMLASYLIDGIRQAQPGAREKEGI